MIWSPATLELWDSHQAGAVTSMNRRRTEGTARVEADVRNSKRDFFISYSGEDRLWALWIARVLEQAGYSVLIQDLDFPPGADWVHEMHRAAIESVTTLAVLSHNYLNSMHGEAEWRIAYQADPSGELGGLIPIRVDDVKPPGLLATRVYVDIAGLDEEEAKLQLLQGVRRGPASRIVERVDNSRDAAFPGTLKLAPNPPTTEKMLGDYLLAVAAQYEDLPYVSLRTGIRLSTVYVPQYLEDISTGAPAGSYSSPVSTVARTVDSIVDSDAHMLVEGGPGSGKSSMLGHIATQLAQGGRYLPVIVRANTLHAAEGTFSERLAKSVTHELGGRLIRPLPEDFFAAEQQGKRWLVLVDCLDQIVSARVREKLVADLLHISAVVDAPYRIIIATRPVPMESQHDWSGFIRLRLRPLTDELITEFAETWFRQAQGKDGIETSRQFVSMLKRLQLTELLRTPLVLTMAASVFTRGQAHALPQNRAGIYERFLSLMDDEESERNTRTEFRNAWDQRFGHYGEAIADEIFNARDLILEHVAKELQEGSSKSILDLTTEYLENRWVQSADIKPDSDWLAHQAAALLIRCAPISQAGDDYQFIHETVREYFVATSIIRGGLTPDASPAPEVVAYWKRDSWRQVILFLFGIWNERGKSVDGLLRHIIDDRPDGVVFAASAIGEGSHVSPAVRSEIVRALGSLIRTLSWGQILFSDPNPFRVMASLGDAMCADELLAIVLDSTAEVPTRAFSAEMLSEFTPTTRTFEVLLALSRDTREVMVKYGASASLAQMGRLDIALPALEEVIADPTAGLLLRSRAVDSLARYDATRSLLRVATQSSLHTTLREMAAAHLEARRHGREAAEILSALIEDDRVDARLRERAVSALSRGGETSALRDIADSRLVASWIRTLAARSLADAGDPAGAIQRLRIIAWDQHLDERVRVRAVHALCALNDDDGVLSLAKTADGLVQLTAASGAPRKGNLEHLVSVARRQATDLELPADVRHEAADVLHRLGETQEAAKLLLSMARSAQVSAHVREEAVLSLHNGQHASELLSICEDPTLPSWLRVSSCEAISQMGVIVDLTKRPFFSEIRESADDWLQRRMDVLGKGLVG